MPGNHRARIDDLQEDDLGMISLRQIRDVVQNRFGAL